MSSRLSQWAKVLESRTGFGAWLSGLAKQPVPGGGHRFVHALGGVLAFLFVVEVVTGIALAFVYAPTVTDAWGSVHLIEHKVVLGWLVRGIHAHAASAMVVVSILYLTGLLMTAGYRAPHEGQWWIACLLTALLFAAGVTAYVLPWDQAGYWANQTELNIIRSGPGGALLVPLLTGLDDGNEKLTRFYTLHSMVLPTLVAFLLLLRHWLIKKHGFAGLQPDAKKAPKPYWPGQALWVLVLSMVAMGVVVGLAVLVGVALEAPADPSTVFDARPKWYMLFLFRLLKFFDTSTAFVGTVIIPGFAAGFLLAVPLLDRREKGAPLRRVWVPFALLVLGAFSLTGLALYDDATDENVQKMKGEASRDAKLASDLALQGGVDAKGRVTLFAGYKLFVSSGCVTCHSKDAKQAAGPLLKGYGSFERIRRFMKDPNHDDFYGKNEVFAESMSEFEGTEDELAAVSNWLYSLSGREAPDAKAARRGYAVFAKGEHSCTDCHNDPARGSYGKGYKRGLDGPDLNGYLGYEWTRRVIRDASHPSLFGTLISPENKNDVMPAYPDLSPDALDLLVTWLQAGAPGAD